jgi:hypothetical protein
MKSACTVSLSIELGAYQWRELCRKSEYFTFLPIKSAR